MTVAFPEKPTKPPRVHGVYLEPTGSHDDDPFNNPHDTTKYVSKICKKCDGSGHLMYMRHPSPCSFPDRVKHCPDCKGTGKLKKELISTPEPEDVPCETLDGRDWPVEKHKRGTIPFTENQVIVYLDRCILHWREELNKVNNRDRVLMVTHYLDAFQSMRMTLFGETLK